MEDSTRIMLLWLEGQGATGMSHKDVDFRRSPEYGLSCFAMHDYNINDIIFKIPRKCLIGFPIASKSSCCRFIQNTLSKDSDLDESQLTCELSMFLFVLQQLKDVNSFFHPYINSLDQPDSPSILSWSENLLSCFQGTNLSHTVGKTQANLIEKVQFIHQIIDHIKQSQSTTTSTCPSDLLPILESIDYQQLVWVWGHYLSRRYPGHFCQQIAELDMASSSPTITDRDIQTHKRYEQYRETELGNIGSLVPLLDILNHNYDHDWLRFEFCDGEFLSVFCNHPVKQVYIYSLPLYDIHSFIHLFTILSND